MNCQNSVLPSGVNPLLENKTVNHSFKPDLKQAFIKLVRLMVSLAMSFSGFPESGHESHLAEA